MKIKSLSIKNNFLGWEFDEINFSSNLTLLVGVSGVGKTQILRAIDDLQDIANGKSINGFEWRIIFSTVLEKEFTWEGAFTVSEDSEKQFNIVFEGENENEDKRKPTILFERLREGKSDTYLIQRDEDTIRFNGNIMPKLSSTQSMIHILREENNIKEVIDAFKKIVFKDHTRREGVRIAFSSKPFIQLKEKYTNLEEIKNSNEDIRLKLFLCSGLNLSIFNVVRNRFIEIFPQIEDIKIEQLDEENFPFRTEQTIPIISIKEKDVPKWIREDRMSSGMLRTIIHICEIYLSNDGSVILIDEFENSLGINCIDILTDDLIHENKTLQFIATSHHPYIINNIPYEYWKIVSRKGGKIQVRDASGYNLGKSKQDAFLQLTKILEKQL